MDGRTDGQMYGRIDRQMDGQTDTTSYKMSIWFPCNALQLEKKYVLAVVFVVDGVVDGGGSGGSVSGGGGGNGGGDDGQPCTRATMDEKGDNISSNMIVSIFVSRLRTHNGAKEDGCL